MRLRPGSKGGCNSARLEREWQQLEASRCCRFSVVGSGALLPSRHVTAVCGSSLSSAGWTQSPRRDDSGFGASSRAATAVGLLCVSLADASSKFKLSVGVVGVRTTPVSGTA